MIVTRWNPSANGPLHLGHIFTLLVNEYFAKKYSGKFYIRFDDTSPNILEMKHSMVDEIIEEQLDDVKWLKIQYDDIIYQSEVQREVEKKLKVFGHIPLEEKKIGHYLPIFVRLGMSFVPYPYAPEQIVERVIMDNMLSVTHVIRGEDFSTEYSLYMYYCQKYFLFQPEFIFLPRLMCSRGDISKTNGGNTIKELRGKGYSADDVISLLEKSCLYYPYNGWEIYNIRPNPIINL